MSELSWEIPEHLMEIHKRQYNQSEQKADQDYYRLERLFIKPLFRRSDRVIATAKQWAKVDSKRKLKALIKTEIFRIANDLGLDYPAIKPLSLKYSRSKKNGGRSFYCYESRTVFLNESWVDDSLLSVPGSVSLLFTLYHELSHCLCDRWFFCGEGHGPSFHFAFMHVLQRYAGLNPNKLYASKTEGDGCRMVDFDTFCIETGGFFRAQNKQHIRLMRFNSVDAAYGSIKAAYGLSVDEESRLDPSVRECAHHWTKSEGSVFNDYEIKLSVHRDEILVIVYREKKLMHFQHLRYLEYLERTHKRLAGFAQRRRSIGA